MLSLREHHGAPREHHRALREHHGTLGSTLPSTGPFLFSYFPYHGETQQRFTAEP